MWPLQQAEISFMPHAVLGYATLIRSRSTSVETDISSADISLLPCSVGSAGDMPRPDVQLQLGDYKLAMEGMTLDLGEFNQNRRAQHRSNREESRG